MILRTNIYGRSPGISLCVNKAVPSIGDNLIRKNIQMIVTSLHLEAIITSSLFSGIHTAYIQFLRL
ncbi:Uncharacterised protein [Bacteroides xylanisolvens]|nr:Uncharacterised protein [Bacteroides xylanisolvens]